MPTPAATVSVIIPTFNRPEMLARALHSVLSQTYQDFEVIVVDDHSIMQSVAKTVQAFGDRRLRYIRHCRNLGPSAARNTAIDSATGQYLAFLDDDDHWLAPKLALQLQALEQYDAVLCAAINSSGRRRECYRQGPVEMAVLRRGNIFPPSGLAARAGVFRDLRFDVELPSSVGEDWDLYIRIAREFRLGYLSTPLFVYNDDVDVRRITSEQADMPIAALERRTRVVHKHKEFFGWFWSRYHIASTLLIYIARRRNKWSQIYYAVRRAGLVAVSAVFVRRLARRLNQTLADFAFTR